MFIELEISYMFMKYRSKNTAFPRGNTYERRGSLLEKMKKEKNKQLWLLL